MPAAPRVWLSPTTTLTGGFNAGRVARTAGTDVGVTAATATAVAGDGAAAGGVHATASRVNVPQASRHPAITDQRIVPPFRGHYGAPAGCQQRVYAAASRRRLAS